MNFEGVHDLRYLGIFIVSGKQFSCNYSPARKTFLWAFNSIYKNVGNKENVTLLTFLLTTQCTPILHGVEAVGAERYEFKRLCYTYDWAFMKIFSTYDPKNIICCQRYSYIWTFRPVYKNVGNKENVTLLTFLLTTQCTPILHGVEAVHIPSYTYEGIWTFRPVFEILLSLDISTVFAAKFSLYLIFHYVYCIAIYLVK